VLAHRARAAATVAAAGHPRAASAGGEEGERAACVGMCVHIWMDRTFGIEYFEQRKDMQDSKVKGWSQLLSRLLTARVQGHGNF
jgi:hypothetical protein